MFTAINSRPVREFEESKAPEPVNGNGQQPAEAIETLEQDVRQRVRQWTTITTVVPKKPQPR